MQSAAAPPPAVGGHPGCWSTLPAHVAVVLWCSWCWRSAIKLAF